MSLPPSTSSIEWLEATHERMLALQELLRRVFPADLFAYLSENEIANVQWSQSHDGLPYPVRRFPLPLPLSSALPLSIINYPLFITHHVYTSKHLND
jgi:hypothetical protein